MNMNECNTEIERIRHRNLIIVEGKNEESKLFSLIFQAFPEININ